MINLSSLIGIGVIIGGLMSLCVYEAAEEKPNAEELSGYFCKLCKTDVKSEDVQEDYQQGDAIHTICGCILDNLIDMGSEWRSFANDGNGSGVDPSRVGGVENLNLQDKGLSTSIAVDASKGRAGGHLSKANNMGAMSNTDRNLITAFREIDRMKDTMQLPQSVAEIAKDLYKDVEKQKSLRGRSGEAIMAACLYIACRKEDVPRTLKEMATQLYVNLKELGSQFTFVKQLLKYNDKMTVIQAADYMDRFCNKLALTDRDARAAAHVASTATELGVVAGKSPISVAAAAIFFLCSLMPLDGRPERAFIASVTGVSESTIRVAYNSMYPSRHQLLPPEWKPYLAVDSLPS